MDLKEDIPSFSKRHLFIKAGITHKVRGGRRRELFSPGKGRDTLK